MEKEFIGLKEVLKLLRFSEVPLFDVEQASLQGWNCYKILFIHDSFL